MQRLTIIGSTGSIGKATLEVAKHLNYKVFALAGGINYQVLAKQVIQHQPKIVVTIDEKVKNKLFQVLKSSTRKVTILSGESGLSEIATAQETNILVMAMSGTQGIIPLLKAIKKKKRIALSTKELLVSFGKIIMSKAKKYDAQIIPIDSELVGLHQCLYARDPTEIKKVIITASGGPFLKRKSLTNIKIAETLKHPIWKMGKKITIDSATLANKGLEVIETSQLFSLPATKIEVLIHPQSIIHAMVEFIDNSVLAQMSLPDMRICIQYALTFPQRFISLTKNLNLSALNKLEFYPPDMNKFPALKLAYKALVMNGTAPCIYNTANEVAVNNFINGKISFHRIPKIINQTINTLPNIKNPDLKTLIKYEQIAQNYAETIC